MADRSAGPRAFDAAAPTLAEAAERWRRAEPLPGGVLVVARRDGPIGILPFGVADLARSQPVTDRHLFQIGSISKFCAAVLVGRLLDDGRVDLDDPVAAHLPWLELGAYTDRVTVARLLSHTAGLVSGADSLTDELAQAWSLRHRSSFEPGTRFHYSNVGYVLVGLLVSHLHGRHHGAVLESDVFGPLGLRGAVGAIRNADRPRMAVGYAPAVDDRPWLPGDALAPAAWLEAFGADGNVALDANGMGALLRLLLGDGRVGSTRIVSADVMRRLAVPSAPGGEPNAGAEVGLPVRTSRYALGINVETIGGTRCLTHGGGMVGYASFVLADPERDLAVGVMTNADGDCLAAQALARYAHRVLAVGDGESVDLPEHLVEPVRRAAARPDAELAGLAGTDARGDELPLVIERDRIAGVLRCRAAAPAVGEGARATGVLLQDAYGRYCTDHPLLRSEYLHRLAPPGSLGQPPSGGPELAGHYRAHNPWLSNFRIRLRAGVHVLTTTGGVEAPTDDEELVPLPDGSYRVGSEGWRPERLMPVALVAGEAVLLDLDGCRYARTPAD